MSKDRKDFKRHLFESAAPLPAWPYSRSIMRYEPLDGTISPRTSLAHMVMETVACVEDDSLRGQFEDEVKAHMISEWDKIALEVVLTGDPSLISSTVASGPAPTPEAILADIAATIEKTIKLPPVPAFLVSLFASDVGDGVMRLPPSPSLPFEAGYLATVAAAKKLHQLVPLQLVQVMGPATGWYRPVCELFGPLRSAPPHGEPRWPPFDDAP